MFDGTVRFFAEIKKTGLTFPAVDVDLQQPNVDHLSLVAPDGKHIEATVHLRSVPSEGEGKRIATEAVESALDRLSIAERVSINNAVLMSSQFVALATQAGGPHVLATVALHLSGSALVERGISAATVTADLEQAAPPGERNFRLFRAALQSASPVEEFMHLYNILLMIFGDRQAAVDAFIVRQDPGVPQSQHPMKAPGQMETIYTRLRNEFGHQRPGVDLSQTKQEMANRVGNLAELTRTAIAQNP
jgi:hypothetical protein